MKPVMLILLLSLSSLSQTNQDGGAPSRVLRGDRRAGRPSNGSGGPSAAFGHNPPGPDTVRRDREVRERFARWTSREENLLTPVYYVKLTSGFPNPEPIPQTPLALSARSIVAN